MNKDLLYIFIIIVLIIILVIGIFTFSSLNVDTNNIQNTTNIIDDNSKIIGNEIVFPDRIVYKDENYKYFELIKDTNEYQSLINVLKICIKSYTTDGKAVTSDELDNLRNSSFLEFDYNTASKNYLISFRDNNLIRLFKDSGQICSSKLENTEYLKNILNNLTENMTPNDLDYKEYPLTTTVVSLSKIKKDSRFENIYENVYQVKISDYDIYKEFEKEYDFNISSISEESFENNIVILTMCNFRDVDIDVNIGNIRYCYSGTSNTYYPNVLRVSTIVNSNCIYNTNLEIPTTEDLVSQHDLQVENLNTSIFETDFTKFYTNYKSSSSKISKSEAKKIAEIGFDEASRIVGDYPKSSETCTLEDVHPNNFFTRKYYEYDFSDPTTVSAYCFSREDELGNGVTIYVDSKLGKIIGGNAFGD